MSTRKFKTLVHYVCWKCSSDPASLGAVKLNKVLWFADVIAFAETGASLTNARYVKQKFGPVPKAILPVLRELVEEENLKIDMVDYYGHLKRQYTALSGPNMSLFTDDEVTKIDEIVEAITQRHTAGSISEFTHDDIWKLANIGEEIPLHAVLACKLGQVTEDDVGRARERVVQEAA